MKAMVGLCRLCASLRKVEVLTAIKDNSSEICDKLRKCCQLNIKMDDNLPKSICQECISSLNISHKFYTRVQEAQETLQALYPFQGNKSTHPAIQKTLTTTHVKKDELNLAKGNINLVETEVIAVSENDVNVLKIEKCEELEQIKKNVPEINSSRKSILEDTYEIVEDVSDITEDLEASRSPHTNGVNQTYAEDQVENQILHKNDDDVQFNLIISKDKCSQSDQVIQQINELLSDDEVNVEIEYMEYLEDEEVENYIDSDKDTETFATKEKPVHNSFSPHDLKLSSWKKYKHICFICDNIFSCFIDLKNHIAQEHNIKQLDNLKYKCFDCKKIIARYSFFLNHVRAVHHPDLKLKCDACDLSCENFDELTHHRTVNCLEAKNFVHTTACSYCFKSFNNTYGLQNHIKFQHISSLKVIYKCKLCNKEFQYKSCLKVHERLHSDIKQFSCDYCDKSFHTKLGLEQHLYAHVEEKIFLCNICHRSYKTSKSLEDHRKLHTEGKVFKCQFCSKIFGRKIQKLTHERSHTGEMPYTCEQCDKKFRYRSALFVHSKIHTGHKPYSCDYCEKSFADSSNRNKHVKRMHTNDRTLENKID